MNHTKAVKVILESGFEGYEISGEFFLVGSVVKCFKDIPKRPGDFAISETGKVTAIL